MAHPIRHFLTKIGEWTAHPAAVSIVLIYSVLWLIFDRSSLDWHGFAALATWLMTLFIQRAEHRDTQAIHAKLDELLRVNDGARSELTSLDEKDPEEIERHRDAARKTD